MNISDLSRNFGDWTKNTFLANVYFGNTLADYFLSLFVFVCSVLLIKNLRNFLLKMVGKVFKFDENEDKNTLWSTLKKTSKRLEYFVVFYISASLLTLHPKVLWAIDKIILISVTFYVVKIIISVIDFIIDKRFADPENIAKRQIIKSIIPMVNFLIWGLGVTFLLSNMGFNISALVAGLGVGGIAVALAAQAILGDLISYVAILTDRPFEIGDTISFDGLIGTVEQIGIKTVRLKSLSGEQLIISNSDITKARLRNFKRMETRRVEFSFGVTYETSNLLLKYIPETVKSIIENTENVDFDRCNLVQFADSSLNFVVVYIVNTGDAKTYFDANEKINLAIKEKFEEMKIEFAYPTQVVYNKD